MSLELYNNVSESCSRLITCEYSTSFSLGIRSLHRSLRQPVYSVYGFVRVADEIVDTFHDYDKEELFERFREETRRAVREKISSNPVLQAYQLVVHRYNIDDELTEAFLRSMEMDLEKREYNSSEYSEYIYGSAEVVGLMCLKIFCDGDNVRYGELKPYARRLGAAFQKINFLRDIGSDYYDRGRVYFPGIDFEVFTEEQKRSIEADIAEDFREALKGIEMLDRRSRFGVWLAYLYYIALFRKIRRAPASEVLTRRFRVSDIGKLLLYVSARVRYVAASRR